MNIFLIGYRCTGKSSVGKMLAQLIGFNFIDTDIEIVKKSNMSIAKIVELKGWQYFRKLESDILKLSADSNNNIIATGGGIVLNSENRDYMKKKGTVVWLKASNETIKLRMINDDQSALFRPSLTDKDIFDEIKHTLLERIPLYNDAMSFSIDTDSFSVKDICNIIQNKIEDD